MRPALILLAVLVVSGLSPSLATESAWVLPIGVVRPAPESDSQQTPPLECNTWRPLRGLEWYNDISDISMLPGTDSMWAVGGSYYGPDGPVTENANPIVCRSTDGGYYWQIDQPEFEVGSIAAANIQLYKVHFVNHRVGFAAGGAAGPGQGPTAAVIFRTTDGGESWASVYEGPLGPFYPRHVIGDLVFADEFNAWAVGAIDQFNEVAIIHTSDGGDTWTAQVSGVNAAVAQVDFVNASAGFAIANLGYTLRTFDGGANWTIASQYSNYLSHGALALEFVNSAVGIATNVGGLILRTTDGGTSWVIAYDPPRRLWELDFFDSNVGWAVGEYGTIMRTPDAGVSWQQVVSPPNIPDLDACVAKDAQTVWMTGKGTIGYTLDNGASWCHIDGDGYITSATFYDIDFVDDQNGWGVGLQGETVQTSDGGMTWHHYRGITTHINAIDFVGTSHGWAAGADAVWHTEDGGANWQWQTTLNPTLIDVHFRDESLGWVSGTYGAIYRTDDGGATWDSLASGTNEGLYSISFVDDYVGWIVGWNGTILHTHDGGDIWEFQEVPTKNPLYSVDFVDPSTGWISGGREIYATNDGGETWQIQHSQTINYITTIDFVDAENGIAVGGRTDVSQVLVTSNGGETWTECGPNLNGQSLALGQKLQGVVMLAPDLAYAAGSQGWVIRIGPRPTAIDPDIPIIASLLDVFPVRPNPFADDAQIAFRLAAQSDVTIEIYDVAGRRVYARRLNQLPAGEHIFRFDGLSSSGTSLPSGIYFQRVAALGIQQTSKIVIIR